MTEAEERLDALLKDHKIASDDYWLLKTELNRFRSLQTALRRSKLVSWHEDRLLVIDYPRNPEWKRLL